MNGLYSMDSKTGTLVTGCIKEVVGYHQEHPNYFRGNIINTENLRIMFESYGFNDASLNLFALVPPSEDFEAYKNTLRVLHRGIRSKLTRSSALLLKNTLQISAKQFFQQNNTHAHKKSLRWIKKKAKNSKSRAATVLREMLLKSEKLVK
jgi:hypothetical protein